MRLSKLHATGNDFLVRVGAGPDDVLDPLTVAALCDRHRGIGADGVITIGTAAGDHDCSMLLQNADGGVAEMSGNGIRCLAAVARRHGLGTAELLIVATGAGRRVLRLDTDDDGAVIAAEVDMGPARFGPDEEIVVDGVAWRGATVDMGNPHAVFVVADPEQVDLAVVGPRIEHDPRFPNRTNVEMVAVRDRANVTMRVWERGVGETLSCGTGVSATAAALHRAGLVDDECSVHVPGGVLRVRLEEHVHLAGPVVHVFDVDIDHDRLLRALR